MGEAALSASAEIARFASGDYLDGLFGGRHGEMGTANPYQTFVASVANRARARRLQLGYDTDEIARRITGAGHKMKGASLDNWERGDLPLKHVPILADALEMDWRELLGVVPQAVSPPKEVPHDLRIEALEAVAALLEGQTEILERLGRIEAALGRRAGGRGGRHL